MREDQKTSELWERVEKLSARRYPSVNPRFMDSVILALRVAFACACVIPLQQLLPDSAIDSKVPDSAIYSKVLPFVVPAIVLTVNLTLSTTVLHGCKSLVGLFIAIGNARILSLFPNGVESVAVLDFAVVSFVVLWLNLHIKTKVIAMSMTSLFVMKYAKPDETIHFHDSFREELEAILFFQTLGVALAILAVLLPSPKLAFTELTQIGATVAKETVAFMSHVTSYQMATERSLSIHLLKSRLEEWRARVQRFGDLSDQAWWEGFDLCQLGPHRAAIKRWWSLLQRQEKSFEVMHLCAAKEEFSTIHTNVMRPMAQVMKDFNHARAIMVFATVSDLFDVKRSMVDAKAELEELADGVERVQQKLIEEWTRSRNSNTDTGLGLRKELRMENFFICTLSQVASRLVEFARGEVAKAGACTRVAVGMQDFRAIFSWNVLSSPSHLNFVWRNFLSLNLAFASGLFIYEYDSEMSVFVSLMLSTTPGAALTKNLGRMQGTVLGMLVGNILFMLLSMSAGWQCQFVAIFLFEALTHFIYFYSNKYGHIGCLLSIFGGKVLISPCTTRFSDDERLMRDAMAYHSFYMLALALSIITAVDAIFFPKPASAMARESLCAAMDNCATQLSKFLSQGPAALESREKCSKALLVDLSKAKMLCDEAEQEPRWHKAPFKFTLFTALIGRFTMMNSHLQVLQDGFDGSKEEDLWALISKRPGFARVKQVLDDYLGHMQTLVRAVLEHEACAPVETTSLGDFYNMSSGGMLKDLEHLPNDIENLVNECREEVKDKLKGQTVPAKAEFDVACNLCVIVSMLEEINQGIIDVIVCTAKKL